jgi:hypothetical protein
MTGWLRLEQQRQLRPVFRQRREELVMSVGAPPPIARFENIAAMNGSN